MKPIFLSSVETLTLDVGEKKKDMFNSQALLKALNVQGNY